MVADMSFSGFARVVSTALVAWLLVSGAAAQTPAAAPAPTVAQAPTVIAASPAAAASPAFVLNSRDATVSQIDRRTMAESGRISVGKEPHHLYPTPDGRSLIVALALSDELLYLDPLTGAVQKRVTGIDDPYQIGFSPDGHWFGVAALRLDRFDLYRHEQGELKLVRRIALPKAPSHLWFSADSRFVFVTLQESDEIAAIDVERQELAWKLPTGRQPAGIMITPDDRYLLVGVMGENYVQVIDWRARQTVGRIITGRGAHNFRGLGDGRHLLVSNRVDNTVSIVDMATLSVVGSIPVPGGPDCIEVTADRREAWITTRWARQVAVVDLAQRRVVRTIQVGRSPHGIYFHDRAPLL
jgi:YVTN family beta-propeller protein